MSFKKDNLDEIFLAEDLFEIDQSLYDLRQFIDGVKPVSELNKFHCHAIMASHVYNDQSFDIPALRELTASGQLHLIKSDDIKLAFSQFSFALEATRSFVYGVSPTALLLARKYPELIQLDPKLDLSKISSFSHQCKYDEMLENPAFRNDLIDNASRMQGFVATLKTQKEALDDIHGILDKELAITHEEQSP